MATDSKPEAPERKRGGTSFADVNRRAEEHAGLSGLLTETEKDEIYRRGQKLFIWAAKVEDTGFNEGARRFRCVFYVTVDDSEKPSSLDKCQRFSYGWTQKRDGLVKAVREAANRNDTPIGPVYLTKRDLGADTSGRPMFAWILSDTPEQGIVAMSNPPTGGPAATFDDDDIPF